MPYEVDRHRVVAERMAGHLDPEKRTRVDAARARLAGVLGLLAAAEDIVREVLAELCAPPAGEPFDLEAADLATYAPGISRPAAAHQFVLDWPSGAAVDPEGAMLLAARGLLESAGPFAAVQNAVAKVADAPGLLGQAMAEALAKLPAERFAAIEAASVNWTSQPDHDAAAEARLREAVEQLQRTAEEAGAGGQELPAGIHELLDLVKQALVR